MGKYSIYYLIHKVLIPWMPEYQAYADSNFYGVWQIRDSVTGPTCGTIVCDMNNGLRVRMDGIELVKKLKTLVLIHNLENEIQIRCEPSETPDEQA